LNRLRAGLVLAALLTSPTTALAQGVPDNVIDDRVRASAAAAESYQGPLDGAWTVVAASGGQALYAFQLVDKPGGQAPLEGVWRDLRRPAMPGDVGFIDSLTRGPQSLAIAFVAKPGDPAVTLDLRSDAAGFWTGDLHEGAVNTPVRMKRG
jgi:hypothetical protein